MVNFVVKVHPKTEKSCPIPIIGSLFISYWYFTDICNCMITRTDSLYEQIRGGSLQVQQERKWLQLGYFS